MASEKFRYQLRQEAQQWQDEGMISPEIYGQLAERYQLEELDSASRDRFIVIVLGLGFILLGLGVITFVAANWQAWSRPIKVLLLLSLFIGANCAGFYLWRSPDQAKSRLGQGLLFLGALSLGANIGLMSQMFHQTGSAYLLYLVWGLGIWAMAYGLGLKSHGIMAIILIAIAYCLGIAQDTIWNGADILPPGLLWGYRDALLFSHTGISFDGINRKLAVFYLGCFFYLCSFNFWESDFNSNQAGKLIDFAPWSSLIAPTIFTIFCIWAWVQLGVRRNSNLPWRLDLNSSYVGATLVFIFVLIWFNLAITPIGIAGTVIFNLLLLALAMILISQSVKEGQRFNFWLGIILLVLQIFSRMFEYNTDLILKAIALFLCGIAAIVAGLWFERYLNTINFDNNQLEN